MPAELRYRAAPADNLAIVALDALTAVYDRRSGQTHLLAAPLPDLLLTLGAEEWTLASFSGQLAAQFDFADDGGDAGAVIALRLAELAAMGLVEIR